MATVSNGLRMPPQAFDELNDFQTAEAIRDLKLPSPTKFGDFWFFDMRITGTGAAYRDALDEFSFRDPEVWLQKSFIDRCNGLPVIFGHPDKGGLNSEEFSDRVIGTIVLPYVKGEEVRGVAKIFDENSVKLITEGPFRSTSPGVTPPKGSTLTTTETGSKVLNEQLPFLVDHVAICENGVWDLGNPENKGIRLDAQPAKEQILTKEEEERLNKELTDARSRADAAEAKMKEFEKADKARADAAAAEEAKEREKADKAKKDADEAERAKVEASEKERADKKRADRKGRHDAAKHNGDGEKCDKCDAAEAEMDKRKDGAPTENVDADQIEELKDARRQDSAVIARMQAQLDALTKQPSIEDRNAVASAFHRADSVYQMLGEPPPLSLPGESSIAYRRRLADGLRKHSVQWKDHAIHDSTTGPAFDLIENAIYNDALNVAKNPVINDSTVGRLREITTTQHGKTKVEFVGDPRAAWVPFMPPMRNLITRFDNSPSRR